MSIEEHTRSRVARRAGALYLLFLVASILASVIGGVGLGDAESLLAMAADHPARFRVGLAIAMLADLTFLLAAWMLYRLLRTVKADAALLMLVLNAVGVAIHVTGFAVLAGALLEGDVAGGSAVVAGAGPGASVAVDIQDMLGVSAQIFFSAWLFPLGYLVLRSGFLPRALGVLILADGVAVLVWFLQVMLLPDLPQLSYPAWAVSFIAEAGLALWLLVRGARTTDGTPETTAA